MMTASTVQAIRAGMRGRGVGFTGGKETKKPEQHKAALAWEKDAQEL
jgi:hypothetical protein